MGPLTCVGYRSPGFFLRARAATRASRVTASGSSLIASGSTRGAPSCKRNRLADGRGVAEGRDRAPGTEAAQRALREAHGSLRGRSRCAPDDRLEGRGRGLDARIQQQRSRGRSADVAFVVNVAAGSGQAGEEMRVGGRQQELASSCPLRGTPRRSAAESAWLGALSLKRRHILDRERPAGRGASDAAVSRTPGAGGKQDRIRISPVVSTPGTRYAACVSLGRDEDPAPPRDSPLHRPLRRMSVRKAFPASAGPPGRRVPEVWARGRLGAHLRQAPCGARRRAEKGSEGGASLENSRRLSPSRPGSGLLTSRPVHGPAVECRGEGGHPGREAALEGQRPGSASRSCCERCCWRSGRSCGRGAECWRSPSC